jgi:hypothetical protein
MPIGKHIALTIHAKPNNFSSVLLLNGYSKHRIAVSLFLKRIHEVARDPLHDASHQSHKPA